LVWYKPDDVRVAYQQMVNDVMACYFEISDAETFDAAQTEDGVDLRFNGIVVASFGVRKMNDHVWVYGTGLVEPLFTTALHSVFAPPESVESETQEAPQPEETAATAAVAETPQKTDAKVLRFPEPEEKV
jgi:hypothetical protein